MKRARREFFVENTLVFHNNLFIIYGLYKIFTDLREEVESYSDLITKSSKSELPFEGQEFGLPITTGIENDFYDLVWQILEPNDYNIEPVTFSSLQSLTVTNFNELESEKLSRCLKDRAPQPIILAEHWPTSSLITIDGNHRLSAAMLQGKKEISAIILKPGQHIDYILSDKMRTLYKVHHNLTLLRNLCAKTLDNFNYSSDISLSSKSYYPLTRPIKFTKLKTLHILARNTLELLRSLIVKGM